MKKNKEDKMYSKLYWKYMRYHWRAFLIAGILSIFFSIGSLLFTWFVLSVFFHFDYNNAMKETKKEERHSELLHALGSKKDSKDVSFVDKQAIQELEELAKYLEQHNDQWGEA